MVEISGIQVSTRGRKVRVLIDSAVNQLFPTNDKDCSAMQVMQDVPLVSYCLELLIAVTIVPIGEVIVKVRDVPVSDVI